MSDIQRWVEKSSWHRFSSPAPTKRNITHETAVLFSFYSMCSGMPALKTTTATYSYHIFHLFSSRQIRHVKWPPLFRLRWNPCILLLRVENDNIPHLVCMLHHVESENHRADRWRWAPAFRGSRSSRRSSPAATSLAWTVVPGVWV